MSTLNIVLKTVERCNLNCSYCYFFNGLDKTYLKRPKYITKEVIKHFAKFLKDGVNRLNLHNVHIVLHGGEPLMQPKEDFIYLMETLKLSNLNAGLSFSIQTNATLVTSSWINLLNRYEVGVGISIDGPREYHNKYRVDHYNNGSYEQVVCGIKLLQQELNNEAGCLAVINPEFDGRQIYRHLVDLGFKKIDFLLPDNNHTNPPAHKIMKYAKYLIEVFDEWAKDNDSEISIRKFKSIILQLLGKPSLIYGFGRNNISDIIPLLAVRSDGEICPTDELISTDPATITLTGKNVCNTTLHEIISHKIFEEIALASGIIPSKCSGCCWYKACGAGNLLGRYSKENRFNNHSVYCSVFQELYAHIASYLINSGVAPQLITNNLFNNDIKVANTN